MRGRASALDAVFAAMDVVEDARLQAKLTNGIKVSRRMRSRARPCRN